MRKSIVKLLKSIALLRAVLEASRDPLGDALAERAAASKASGYGPVFDHFYGELSDVEDELSTAESDYAAAGARLIELRHQRERAATDLYGRHAPIERFCRSQPHLKGAGITGATPESPAALARQAAVTLQFLRGLAADAAPGRTLPPLTPGVSVDAAAVADDLEPGLLPLENAINRVEEGEAIVAAARERANRAFAEADSVASCVGRALESLGGLAGDQGFVRRIRKCGRRRPAAAVPPVEERG